MATYTYCVNCKVGLYEQRYKKRKKRKRRVIVFSLLCLLVFVLCYVFCVVNPVVVEATRASIFSLSTSAVSDAVYDVLSEEYVTYEDLVKIERDNENNVVLISLDTIRLNLMARRFYQVAQVYLDKMGKGGVDVSVGIFTGLPFLSGVGPNINLKLTPIGAMTSTFESTFVGVDINQTKHSLFIRLYASVSLILPAYSSSIDSVTEVLVAENVIVGKVPQVYLSGETLSYKPTTN